MLQGIWRVKGQRPLLQTNSTLDMNLLVKKEEREGLFNNFCNALYLEVFFESFLEVLLESVPLV